MSRFEEAFLHDIVEHPDDDAPRLIYADWLEDHADLAGPASQPAAARARFIRLQCTLARLDPDDDLQPEVERESRALAHRHHRAWLGPLASFLQGHTFRRGFVEKVKLSAGALLHHGEELFRSNPIRDVNLRQAAQEAGRLVGAPHLSRLARLDLRNGQLSGEAVDSLVRWPLDRIERLALDSNRLADAAVHRLTRAPWVRRLTHLGLSRSHLGPAACHHLAAAALDALEELDLGGNRLGIAGLQLLLAGAPWPRLHALGLGSTGIHTGMLDELARAPCLARLEALDLSGNPIGDDGIPVLAGAAFANGLRSLDLSGTQLTAAGVRHLAAARFPALERLNLSVYHLGPDGGEYLAGATGLGGLRELHLTYTRLGDEGVKALAGSPLLGSLRLLDLRGTGFQDAGAAALARSPYLGRLRTLDLRGSPIGEAGARALADSAALGGLRLLDLRGCPGIPSRVHRLLRERFGADACRL